MLARAGITGATAEAHKWRPDSYLFQVAALRVTDGVTMWTYGFYSPGATGRKCYLVNVAPTGEAGGATSSCAFDPEQKLADFSIDSDKAVATARKAGLAKQALQVTLRMFPVRNMGDRPVWQVSEGAGMGDKTIEVDAITGEIRNQVVIK